MARSRPLLAELRAFVEAALLRPVDNPVHESAGQRRRRRFVVAATAVVGAVALGAALAIPPGSGWFYPASLAVAVLWAIGAFASGPLHLGSGRTRRGGRSRGVLQGFLLGAALLAIFLLAALVVARIPVLRAPVEGLLDHARLGSLALVALITLVNGVAEELFFRGAVYAALNPRHSVLGSTVLYAATTVFSGVLLLTFAAVCLGALTAAQRRVTGGVAAPIAAHLTWSLGMLFFLPPVLSLGV